MSRNKKIIGVVPLWDDNKQSIWMLPGYMDRITQAGGSPGWSSGSGLPHEAQIYLGHSVASRVHKAGGCSE